MQKKKIKIIILFTIISASMLAGHKMSGLSKKMWKFSERYYYFTLKKIGLKNLGKKNRNCKIVTHENDEC